MANSEIKKSSRVRKNFYAVAKGHTTGIFTSWSLCSRSVDKFQGQIYKGFPDINSALDFLSPYSFKCTTTPVYDDLGKRKNVKEYQHTCCNCDTSLSTEIVNDQSENSRNHNINSVITSNSTSELIDSDTDSNISELECQDDLENTVISINTDNNNNTAPLKQHDDLQSQQTELKRVFQLAKTCCICHTQDDSSMITCNSCNKWTHYSCTNLPPYILFTLSSTQRKYTCRKCVVIPEDFIQKLENNKNASTTNASCQTSIDNQPDGSYLDSVASRFQESLVTSINTLNRDLPNRESDLTATIEKVNNIEQILKEKLATIITMLSHSNEERAQSDASLLEMGKKVKQTSVKLDQIQKDIKVLNSLQEPSLYELVEKSCMMIPIIKNATQDLPKDRKKMDGVVQQVQKLGNQIKTSSEEHQSKLEDINDTMHALSENTTKPIYACKVQNKFELLENEKLCTNIDVEKVSDKICNSDENLCTNFNEKNEHNDTFTPVVNSPKGNTQNKNSVGNSPKGNTQNRISGQSSQTTKNPDHTRQSIDKQTNKRGSINKQNTQKKILLLGNSHLRPIRTNEFIRGYSVRKQLCYTIEKTKSYIKSCTEVFDCIALHLFTNDVRNKENMENACGEFASLVDSIHVKWPSASIVVSLGICRGDSYILNQKIQECNIILQHIFMHKKYIHLCDNSSLGYRGNANYRFLNFDKVHLNFEGTKVFVTNLKYALYKALNIKRNRNTQGSWISDQNNYDWNYPYFR